MSRKEAGSLGGKKTAIIWRERYERCPRHCKLCNVKLSYEQRSNTFCGHACSAKFNNSKRKNKSSQCIQCGEVANRMFCSGKCHQNFEWDKRKKVIEESGSTVSFGKVTAKRYLLEVRGNFCSCCGKDAIWQSQPLVLVLDHVDGNPNNWNLSNLRLVCPNCDSQLPTYKGKNKGNGRHARRQRYKLGKSY